MREDAEEESEDGAFKNCQQAPIANHEVDAYPFRTHYQSDDVGNTGARYFQSFQP